jgi:hypothetical protein
MTHRRFRNISSPSKLQRAPEVPLQQNTVQTLKEAQETVQKTRLLSVQATKPESFVQVQVEKTTSEIQYNDAANHPSALQMHSNSMFMFRPVSNPGGTIPDPRQYFGQPRSLKSSSSSESFKSAVDEQEPDIGVVREVESVLHAFRTALEVLEKVVKRLQVEDKALRNETESLKLSLMKSLDIGHAHRYDGKSSPMNNH